MAATPDHPTRRPLWPTLVIGFGALYFLFWAAGLMNVAFWLAAFGRLTPASYLGWWVLITPTMFPDSVLGALGGARFGPVLGPALVAGGSLVSTAMQFALARTVLHRFFARRFEEDPYLGRLGKMLARGDVGLLLLVRLTPINPALVSYLMGVSGVSWRAFFASWIAVVPSHVLSALAGYVAVGAVDGTGWRAERVASAVLLAVGVAALIQITRRFRRELRALRQAPAES